MSDSPQPEPLPPTRRMLLSVWSVAKWVFFSIGCAFTLLVGACVVEHVYRAIDTSTTWSCEHLAPVKDVELIDSSLNYEDLMHGDRSASYLIRLRTPEAAARFVQEILKREPLTGEYAMECDAPFAFSGTLYDRCRREFGAAGTHYRFSLYADCPHYDHGLHHRNTMVHIYGGENNVFYVNIQSN